MHHFSVLKEFSINHNSLFLIEQLVLSDYKNVEKSWEDDFDPMVIPMIEPGQPSYILYRYDWFLHFLLHVHLSDQIIAYFDFLQT